MPKRVNIALASPDGHVLFVEEARILLGIGADVTNALSSADSANPGPRLFLVGHNMEQDFKAMEDDGIELGNHFYYSGCIDTHVIIEDTEGSMPKGLSGLMGYYGFAKCKYSKPKRGVGKLVFVGAHNAGNDAVATLKVAIAQALDLAIKTRRHHECTGEEQLPAKWYDEPLKGLDPNMIWLAYDCETAEINSYNPGALSRTTEHGFAWWRAADCLEVPPGLHGVNWHPYIQARHWINRDFRGYENMLWVVGNSRGFWREYGNSEYYDARDGPAPFHALFARMAVEHAVLKAATSNAIKGTRILKSMPSTPLSTIDPAVEQLGQYPGAPKLGRIPVSSKSERSAGKKPVSGGNSSRRCLSDRADLPIRYNLPIISNASFTASPSTTHIMTVKSSDKTIATNSTTTAKAKTN